MGRCIGLSLKVTCGWWFPAGGWLYGSVAFCAADWVELVMFLEGMCLGTRRRVFGVGG